MPAEQPASSSGSVAPEMAEPTEPALITPAMLEEEEQLEAAGLERERKMLEEARMSWDRESTEIRYRRLQHLLEKSNIYSKFLLTKMEQQQLEEQKKKEKLEKKKRSLKVVEVIIYATGLLAAFNIKLLIKYFSLQDESSSTANLCVEDLQKNKDSNSIIKDRLSQTVRENSKSFFDPVRKCNGQPVPFQQPKHFTGGVMRWYQVEGMEWLRMLWENGINGILADEMGLGKTVQCIATIALMIQRGVPGPFLVCGPLSTLPNWMAEFKRFTPEHCYWKYLIVDEGHRIKNMKCRLIRELKRFNADNKLLLTGTPLQNNLSELWSLLNFLLPDVFDDLKSSSFFLSTFKIDEELVTNSGKFLILDRMLPELKKRGHKVLVFSQMTSMLDILMDYCQLRNFTFSRLDGSMSYSEREKNIYSFNMDPDVFLFLVSTRAGGLGINLTAADTVIIYDSDWNPQSDLQAQDRCHRIGQTKPVVVYRLVTANTIDQKIVERAAAKRKLEKLIIHKNHFKGGQSGLSQSKNFLDPKELMELLKSRDYEREVKGSREKVISDEDLELLLDRSDLIDQMKASRPIKEKTGIFKILENSEDSNAECLF
ncbi:lymphoid-specific helicase [Alexandromys fortis]|uniref:lymphoid-specific helicase n=1 Tax=Alexandromys fortis TaxID=100897 RepID=UPI0021532E17|nr:lymphoid-specific helicase [Microtus fortis]